MDSCHTYWIKVKQRQVAETKLNPGYGSDRVIAIMKTSSISTLVAVLLVLMLIVCKPACAEYSSRGVVHTVFLWLKQPGNDQYRHQLLRASEQLRAIPGVVDIRYGETITSDRAIVDDSFDVGIYIYFSDVETMNRYLAHPKHKRLVEQALKPIVDRIVVYDFHDVGIR